MGYWKSKVLPKIKKVFAVKKDAPAVGAEKPAEETATEESNKAKEVEVEGAGEEKKEEVAKKAEEGASGEAAETAAPAAAAAEVVEAAAKA